MKNIFVNYKPYIRLTNVELSNLDWAEVGIPKVKETKIL